MGKFFIGSIAIATFLATQPVAADPTVKRPASNAPFIAASAPYIWTGCYVGGNVGYGWAPTQWSQAGTEFASHTADGVIGGGQIGCDYQTGPWVLGIQTMFDSSGLKGSSHKVVGALGPNIFDQSRVSWFSTLTGRIGYTVQSATLLYVKGGAAWVRDKHDECCLATVQLLDDGFARLTRNGWTIGAGLEYMFQPNWSVFAEYDYLGLGTRGVTFTPTGLALNSFVYDIRQNVQTVLVGFNYRFGGTGK